MKFKKALATLIGLGAIFVVLVAVDVLEPQPVVAKLKPQVKEPVSVLEVIPTTHDSSLTLLATTSARWLIQLKTSSSAQLVWLNRDIEPGSLVTKGTHLAQLNDSALKANLAQANSGVKQAELNLKQAQHEQTVALKMLPSKKGSPFARREPQVSLAKAELNQAIQGYASATKLLEEAMIVAPFDAVIMYRHISPGEWLEASQVTFELAASDSLDVELPVSELHWQRVQSALHKPEIKVLNRDGSEWPAQVRYVAPQADITTRQRKVILSVEQPYHGANPLLPNQQVKVVISLGTQPNIVALPLSAITRDGYVWTLDEQNHLQKEWVQLIEQAPDRVYCRFENESTKVRLVVVYPLQSMLPGKQVSPNPAPIVVTSQESNQ